MAKEQQSGNETRAKQNQRERIFVLNDPYPMRISKELAAEIGLNDSIVLLQLEYLLSISRWYMEGYCWTYQTLEGLVAQFPWWSKSTIARSLDRLEQQELIFRTARFNNPKKDERRTFWYRLDSRGISRLKSIRMDAEDGEETEAGADEPGGDPLMAQQEPDGPPEDSTDEDQTPVSQNEKSTKADTYGFSQNEKSDSLAEEDRFLNLQSCFLKMRNLYTHRLRAETTSRDLPSVGPSDAPAHEKGPTESEAESTNRLTDRPTEPKTSNQTSESSPPVQLLEEHEAHQEDSDAGELSPREDEDNATPKPEEALRQQVEAIPTSEVSEDARQLTGEVLRELPALSERDQLRTARLAEHYQRLQRTRVLSIAASGVALYATQQRIRHPFSYLLACCVDAEGERSEGDEDLLASLSGHNSLPPSAESKPAGYERFFSSGEQESDAGEGQQRQHTPDPDPDAQVLWEKILEDVSGEINAPSLRVWFEGTVPVSLTAETLTVSVPNTFAKDYIESRFKELLEGALAKRLSPTSSLEIVVGVEGSTDNTNRKGGAKEDSE